MSYAYDGDGDRVSRSLSGTLTRYLLDTQPGLTVVLSEATGANMTRYIHGPTGILAQQNPDNAMHWMLQDGLQSVRAISDGMNVLSAQAYSPYGEPMFTDMPTEFGFTGEQTDPTNDLVYLRARYMNPKLGIFGSLDPLEGELSAPLTMNGYGWVEGNTPNLRDATGWSTTCDTPSNTLSPVSIGLATMSSYRATQGCQDISIFGRCLFNNKGGGGGGGGVALSFVKWLIDTWGVSNTLKDIATTGNTLRRPDESIGSEPDYSKIKEVLERMGGVAQDLWNVAQFSDNAQSQAQSQTNATDNADSSNPCKGKRTCISIGYSLSYQQARSIVSANTGVKENQMSSHSPTATTVKGPCIGEGRHINLRQGKKQLGTIVCCPCCDVLSVIPRVMEKCRLA